MSKGIERAKRKRAHAEQLASLQALLAAIVRHHGPISSRQMRDVASRLIARHGLRNAIQHVAGRASA